MTNHRLDVAKLDSQGYCVGGSLQPSWPDAGPDEPVRDVLGNPGWANELARSPAMLGIASKALGGAAHAVRANLFVNSEASNWHVAWHQDRVVCVRERIDVPGFSGWSTKAGEPHANAPLRVLKRMVALRLHLDPCNEDAGPLEVIPGSHEMVHSVDSIAATTTSPRLIRAEVGSVLVLRPLLLHRSTSMRAKVVRRVLHVEYASEPLLPPLAWRYW